MPDTFSHFDLNAMPKPDVYKLLASVIMPRPIAWVVSRDIAGSLNAAPFSFFNILSADPPLIAISFSAASDREGKDTLSNIRDHNDFVVNLVPEELAPEMNITATNAPRGPDETQLHPPGARALRPRPPRGLRQPRAPLHRPAQASSHRPHARLRRLLPHHRHLHHRPQILAARRIAGSNRFPRIERQTFFLRPNDVRCYASSATLPRRKPLANSLGADRRSRPHPHLLAADAPFHSRPIPHVGRRRPHLFWLRELEDARLRPQPGASADGQADRHPPSASARPQSPHHRSSLLQGRSLPRRPRTALSQWPGRRRPLRRQHAHLPRATLRLHFF